MKIINSEKKAFTNEKKLWFWGIFPFCIAVMLSGCLNKKVILIVSVSALILGGLACLAAPRDNIKQKSFFAHTSNECLAEKECIWDAFSRIAFGAEADDAKAVNYLRKWERPIFIEIAGTYNKKLLSLLQDYMWFAKNIAAIPEMKIVSKAPVNLTVIFTNDLDKAIYTTFKKDISKIYSKHYDDGRGFFQEYEAIKKLGSIRCLGSMQTDKNNRIYSAVVFIPNNLEESAIKGCLQEEITQIMGLPNDVRGAIYTKFNDSNTSKELTVLDWTLLRILYNSGMKVGMDKKQARQVFDSIYGLYTVN